MEKAESGLDSTEKATLKRQEFTKRSNLIQATLTLESWLVMNCPTIGQQYSTAKVPGDFLTYFKVPCLTIRKQLETRNAYKIGTLLSYKREDHHFTTSLFAPHEASHKDAHPYAHPSPLLSSV